MLFPVSVPSLPVRNGKTDLDKLFDSISRPLWEYRPNNNSVIPKVEVRDLGESVNYLFEVPGLNKDNLEIFFENGSLVVRGKKEAIYDGKPKYTEHTYGSFERTIQVGEDLNMDKIEATCENGILEVSIPRKRSAKPQKINIK